MAFTQKSYDKDVYEQSFKSKINTYFNDPSFVNNVCMPGNTKTMPNRPLNMSILVDQESELKGLTRKLTKDITQLYPFKQSKVNMNITVDNCADNNTMQFTRLQPMEINNHINLDRMNPDYSNPEDINKQDLKYLPSNSRQGLNTREIYRDNFHKK